MVNILGVDVGMNVKELWKPICGYESAYQISNFGRVKSCKRLVKNRWGYRVVNERILKQKQDKDGYFMVELSLKSSYKTNKVHHLVLNSFFGKRKKGEICRHLDGNNSNNHIDNLKWGTPEENSKDKKKHGTELYGDKKPNSIFKNEDIIKIRNMAKIYSVKDLSLLYNVRTNYITRIINGQRYKNV